MERPPQRTFYISGDVLVKTRLECHYDLRMTSLYPGVYAQSFIVEMCGVAFLQDHLTAGTIVTIEEAPL